MHLDSTRALAVAALALASLAPRSAADIQPQHVLLVVNDASPISMAIGNYYANLRGIPPQNVFHLPTGTTTSEQITRDQYNLQVRDPIKTYLSVTAPTLQSQIRCILLTKGVPLAVMNNGPGGGGLTQNAASVDSELTQLFTGAVPDAGQNGRISNPYYGNQQGFESMVSNNMSYLVCRLDGYADQIDGTTGVPVDIKNLIDRSQTPSAMGVYLLDGDPTKTAGYASGESWMNTADTTLNGLGLAVAHDTTTAFVVNQPSILGYASWGSNDSNSVGPPYYGSINGNSVPGTFLPGSIATDYVSTSARSFAFGTPYGQSLIADLIRMGCTGANGHVYEPFLDAVSQPDKLFVKYVRGFTAAESFYTSIRWLSWENVIVCDPLMRKMQTTSKITSVVSAQGPPSGGTTFTIIGNGFSELANTTVTVGGAPAQVLTVLVNQMQVVSPPHGPGPADIVMTNPSGTFTATAKFEYTPSLVTLQNPQINATWIFTVYGMETMDGWVLFEGTPAPPFPFPPLGDLLVDPTAPIFQIASGFIPQPFAFQSVGLPIPNVPAAVGTQHRMQAIVASPGGTSILLTNAIDVTIQ